MAKLPNELPCWYQLAEDKEKGWMPKTSDIIDKPENKDIVHAWNGQIHHPLTKKIDEYTCRLERLQILSPIQVGGGKFPEGGILPAQIGGVPCIPGSSVRGSLLCWMRKIWEQLPADEKIFWESLMMPDRKSWQPRRIRFESLLLLDSKQGNEKEDTLLKPFPLNAQQSWQIFGEKSNSLGMQWQIPPSEITPADSRGATKRIPPNRFPLQVKLKGDPTRLPAIHPPTQQQLEWLRLRLTEMLKEQGIGRGTHSGFGRLGEDIPKGTWVLELTGMKPCVQQHATKKGQVEQKGRYRWSPQVLRANLRGHFMRLALNILGREHAEELTNKIWGGLKSPAQLTLTSYLKDRIEGKDAPTSYTNILAKTAHEKWVIYVQTDERFKPLVGRLLEFASRIGGLGPGWRRPPHEMNHGVYRGSKFTVKTDQANLSLSDLIGQILNDIKSLAQEYGPWITAPQTIPRIVSIWKGETEQWDELVHGVCRSKDNPNHPNPGRPPWCGDSKDRPSGYAVREHEDYCLVTVFDKEVEATLEEHEYERIWNSRTGA
jgi:CRISPR-associated protein Cmr6